MYHCKAYDFCHSVTRVFLTAGLAVCFLLAVCFPARADGGLTVHTDYPGITAKAGESLSFEVALDNSAAACDTTLSVTNIPEGWEAYFSGGGNQINRVFVPNGANAASATLHVTVPSDTAEGTYGIGILASGDNGASDSMVIELSINELKAGQGNFSTEYAEQEGASGTSFSFSATLVNNSADTQSYSLSAKTPEGWQASFKPSGESTQVAAIDVESARSQGLTITVTPPNNVESGTYTIPCSAISAGETLNMDLSVTITGSYLMDVTTPDGRLSFDAHANEKSTVTLSVTNQGNVDLQNVNLASTPPTGWTVEFDNSTIDVLEAGATKEVTAYVTPSSDAMTGDYVLSIKANSTEVSDSAEFRVSVKTKTVWGFVAVGLIVVLAGGIGFVFHKYGRR